MNDEIVEMKKELGRIFKNITIMNTNLVQHIVPDIVDRNEDLLNKMLTGMRMRKEHDEKIARLSDRKTQRQFELYAFRVVCFLILFFKIVALALFRYFNDTEVSSYNDLILGVIALLDTVAVSLNIHTGYVGGKRNAFSRVKDFLPEEKLLLTNTDAWRPKLITLRGSDYNLSYERMGL
uniref:Uncharacterized protein n=1 Tax=Lepeophtheirus salmonis TaxID=72036 RepID=A0A0K2T9N7_LEPSM